MAQNVISTAILIIAAVMAVVALINGVFPAIGQMSGSVSSVTDQSNDRMNTEIKIICVSANQTLGHTVDVYVKNTGSAIVKDNRLPDIDVYYGHNDTDMAQAQALASALVTGNGDANWDPGETLLITVSADDYNFTDGQQQIQVVLANGASDHTEYTLL